MNLPNKLTLLRLAMTVVFVTAMTFDFPLAKTTAFFLFLLAGLTDYADGQIARRWNLITDFGKLMDSLADKVLVTCALICLVELRLVPAWAVTLIVAREFLITGLRTLAASKGTILPAEKLGKHKTFWQMVTIIFYLGTQAAAEWSTAFGPDLPDIATAAQESLGPLLVWITVAFTLYSGVAYLVKHRDLIADC